MAAGRDNPNDTAAKPAQNGPSAQATPSSGNPAQPVRAVPAQSQRDAFSKKRAGGGGMLSALSVISFPADRRLKDKEEGNAALSGRQVFRLRHSLIKWSFLACVLAPVLISSIYLILIAQDQYHADASFAVRSIDSTSGTDILGLFMQASNGNTMSDSYILTDFIRSREMYETVAETIDLEAAFGMRGLDWFFSMRRDLPVEEQVDYWNSMVHVDFDNSSGVISVRAKAFTPEDAKAIAASVVANSATLVNALSATARREIVEVAQAEVRLAEERLREARRALREYRDRTQEVDPLAGAQIAAQLIGSLEGELARANSELRTALSRMDKDSPRVRVLNSKIASLEAQIAAERARLGSGTVEAAPNDLSSGDVAARIQTYERLETEREFAQEAYVSSLASLRSAISDAQRNQRYLATFLSPKLAEQSEYPRRYLLILLVSVGAVFFWGVGVMLYYNLKDRA